MCADAASRLCLVLVLTQAAGDSTLTPAEPTDEASPDYLANISGTASQFMKFEVELGVPPLPLSAARKLALALCPEAGDDLVKVPGLFHVSLTFISTLPCHIISCHVIPYQIKQPINTSSQHTYLLNTPYPINIPVNSFYRTSRREGDCQERCVSSPLMLT